MKLLETIDARLLALFTMFSHKFQRLTGRTNFFLAKLSVALVMLSVAVELVNYWIPILSRKSTLFNVATNGIIAIWLVMCAYQCDEADNQLFSSEKAKYDFLAFWVDPSILRIMWLCLSWVALIIYTPTLFAPKVSIIFDIIDFSYAHGGALFYYFLSVDPLPPGKSKIREWVEAFAAGFKRLVPARLEVSR